VCRVAFFFEIVIEAGYDLLGIETELFKAMVQVEKVAVLAPLKKRPELRPEQFLGRKRCDLRRALMPVTLYRKGDLRQTIEVGVFARVDFDLEIENLTGIDFRAEPEYQVHRMSGLGAFGLSEP
jgi:hypothetical protein